jgi:hypothetical protein
LQEEAELTLGLFCVDASMCRLSWTTTQRVNKSGVGDDDPTTVEPVADPELT